jgi:adenine-specific DNA glycosylase
MVTCILLNQTHGRQVRPLIHEFFCRYPDPQTLSSIDSAQRIEELTNFVRPLGLHNRRAVSLIRNAIDYCAGKPFERCRGIGQYGRDAIAIFVHGRTDVKPTDTWLKPYLEWRLAGGERLRWGE